MTWETVVEAANLRPLKKGQRHVLAPADVN